MKSQRCVFLDEPALRAASARAPSSSSVRGSGRYVADDPDVRMAVMASIARV